MASIREYLSWIQELFRIEDAFDIAFEIDEIRRLFQGKICGSADADAVLAAQGAAEVDGGAHEGFDGAVDGGALGVVVPEEVDVEVAVAGVSVGQVADFG